MTDIRVRLDCYYTVNRIQYPLNGWGFLCLINKNIAKQTSNTEEIRDMLNRVLWFCTFIIISVYISNGLIDGLQNVFD